MYMMFVPHRKHTHTPPLPVTADNVTALVLLSENKTQFRRYHICHDVLSDCDSRVAHTIRAEGNILTAGKSAAGDRIKLNIDLQMYTLQQILHGAVFMTCNDIDEEK
jgi:hypothetical protein